MKFWERIEATWERLSGWFSIQHYVPLRKQERDGSSEGIAETIVSAIGSRNAPLSVVSGGKDDRPAQRNSKRLSRSMAEKIEEVRRTWMRAWKYARHDAGLRDWPSIHIGWEMDSISGERARKYSMDTIEPALDQGFDHASIHICDGSEAKNDKETFANGTRIFTRVATSTHSATCAQSRMLIAHARWFVEYCVVVVPPKGHGRPWVGGEGLAISRDGTILTMASGERDLKRCRVLHIEDDSWPGGWVFFEAVLQGVRAFDWDMELSKGSARFLLPVERVEAREILHDRERPEGASRRPAALHWVKPFTRSDGTFIPAHVRGETHFKWHGWDVRVVSNDHDRRHLDTGTLPTFDRKQFLEDYQREFGVSDEMQSIRKKIKEVR